MPKIPLRTAQTTPDSTRRSSPQPNARAFGGDQSGTATLARAFSSFTDVARALDHRSKERRAQAEADAKIEAAKLDQDLAERISLGRLELRRAAFDAESEVLSDAEIEPGSDEDRALVRPTLVAAFNTKRESAIGAIRSGLDDERGARFDAAMEIYGGEAELKIRQVQRTRDVDAARASLERSEANYLMLADDPLADIDQLVSDYRENVELAVSRGAWTKEQGESIFATTEKAMRATNAGAAMKASVQAETDAIMAMENLTPSEKLKMARDLADPELRSRVVASVEKRNREVAKFDRAALQDRYDQAEHDLLFGNATLADVDIDTFPPKQQTALKTLMLGKPKPVGTGPGKADRIPGSYSDEETFVSLWEMARDDPKSFMDEDLVDHRLKLKRADYNELVKTQKKMLDGEEVETPFEKTGAFNVKPMIKNLYPGDKEMQTWAMARWQEIAISKAEANEAPLSMTESQGLAREVFRREQLERGAFQVAWIRDWLWPVYSQPLIEMSSSEAKAVVETPIADQDERWVEVARRSLESRGVPTADVTPEMLEEEVFGVFEDLGLLDESTLMQPERE